MNYLLARSVLVCKVLTMNLTFKQIHQGGPAKPGGCRFGIFVLDFTGPRAPCCEVHPSLGRFSSRAGLWGAHAELWGDVERTTEREGSCHSFPILRGWLPYPFSMLLILSTFCIILSIWNSYGNVTGIFRKNVQYPWKRKTPLILFFPVKQMTVLEGIHC